MLILLSQPLTISHVTLGHISRLQSPDDFLSSAPRTFTVYGLRTEVGEQIRLGTFVYNRAGESLQTFELPDLKKDVFRFVKLHIDDNWGHENYTCLYNFRVHGKTPMAELEITA
ncbi:SUN domain-containing protein 3-like [Brachyistius frenatus]|uniref:SUN domain-containing protein 3-like n=1 Tax=Brachyistius frenatus TaxID=100188 RepID=UPI0037E82F50